MAVARKDRGDIAEILMTMEHPLKWYVSVF